MSQLAFVGFWVMTHTTLNSNDDVGLLFISFQAPHRIRLHGKATIDTEDPLLKDYVGAQYIVRIAVRNLFMNCSRYIHGHGESTTSEYVPQQGVPTPTPQWKTYDIIKEVLPRDE
jgi:hypothetical protein